MSINGEKTARRLRKYNDIANTHSFSEVMKVMSRKTKYIKKNMKKFGNTEI